MSSLQPNFVSANKTVLWKIGTLKTHTLVSDIGSNSHRTDTNWNIHEGNHNDRIINYIHHMPELWTKFSQSRSEICVFFLYKIVRYFSSYNGIPSINIMVSSKTYFVYVADYDSFLWLQLIPKICREKSSYHSI